MTGNQTGNWREYDQNLSYVTQLGAGILEVLNAQPGEKVLDAGGGTGKQSKELSDKGVDVMLLDNAAEQVAAAQKLLGPQRAVQGDIQNLPPEWVGRFDAVYSNAVFHYLRDPEKAFSEIAKVLKDGGRLVFEMGGSFSQDVFKPGQTNLYHLQNAIGWAASYIPGALPPLVRTDSKHADLEGVEYVYHPTEETITRSLAKAGLMVQSAHTFARPTSVDDRQLSAAINGYASNYTASLLPEERDGFLGLATRRAQQTLPRDNDGKAVMDYVRLQMVAVKQPR